MQLLMGVIYPDDSNNLQHFRHIISYHPLHIAYNKLYNNTVGTYIIEADLDWQKD